MRSGGLFFPAEKLAVRSQRPVSLRLDGDAGRTRHAAGADDPDPAGVVRCKPELVVIGGEDDDKGIRRLTQVIEGKGGKLVNAAAGVIVDILLPASSVNQRLPSGPQVIPAGMPPAVVTAYSVKDCAPATPNPAARPTHDDNQNKPQRQLSRSVTFPHMRISPSPRDDSIPGSLLK